jgi:hypothetical protein
VTRQLTFDGGAGAVVSDDGRYRYALTRTWRPDAPLLTFVMLNPSTADAYADDPTIRRCIGFARREGAAGIRVANLFAYRATSPAALVGPVDAAADDPRVGPLNDRYLGTLPYFERIVVAWGAFHAPERVAHVVRLLQPRALWCLGVTASGAPRHPLYVRADAPLVPWPVAPGTDRPDPG